ncbi:MAG: hypothetical protein ACI31R_02915 [Bacilli bacterium]
MNNKVLIIVKVPFIEKEYQIYIPINKKIGYVKHLIIASIKERNDGNIDNNNFSLIDKNTGNVLDNNKYVKDSTIRNGTELFLI